MTGNKEWTKTRDSHTKLFSVESFILMYKMPRFQARRVFKVMQPYVKYFTDGYRLSYDDYTLKETSN